MDNFMKYDFNINNILLAIFVPRGAGNAVHKNRTGHGLALHLNGKRYYNFSTGEKLTVKQNDIIYMPKHSNYVVSSDILGDCYAINFDIDEEIAFSPFVFHAKDSSAFLEHFKKAQKSHDAKKDGHTLECKAELYNILYKMRQEYNLGYMPASKLRRIMPAVEYIHANYSKELLSIKKLSDMCSITPEYFRSIFRQHYSTSPLVYINNLKTTKAKELIASGMYSVTEAAYACGFSDLSHFSRVFKKSVGVSPSEYR